jgi:hypothetical protein
VKTELWATIFRDTFIKEITTLEEVLENRILLTFASLNKEAEQIKEKKYEQLNRHASEYSNGAEIAEIAEQAGVDYYIYLDNARQSIINMFAVAFYHLFEQQLFDFLRYELLEPEERGNNKLYDVCEVYDRLKKIGIDLKDISSYDNIYHVLRHICNTAKHAAGTSSNKLRKIRPEYFETLFTRQHPETLIKGKRPVSKPFFGEGLYLTLDDLKIYIEAIKSFWEEMAMVFDKL